MNLDLAEKVGGRSNHSPLTTLGELQSAALGRHLSLVFKALRIPCPTQVRYFSSTAVRAYDTARIMMKELGIQSPGDHLLTNDLLLEQNMGTFEGALRTECYTPETLAEIAADTHNFSPPGGESQKQVEERMVAFIKEQVLPACKETGHPAVVVGHGMAFKCFLRHILQSDPQMSRKILIQNTAVSEIGFVEEEGEGDGGATQSGQAGWHLLRVNDTTHLITEF